MERLTCLLCGRTFPSRNRLFGHFSRNDGACLQESVARTSAAPPGESLDDAASIVEILATVIRTHGGCMEVSAAGQALARSCPELWARCRRKKAFSLVDICKGSPLLRVEEMVREDIAERQYLGDLGYRYLLHAVHDGPTLAGNGCEATTSDPTELCVALAKRVLEYSSRHELCGTKRAPAVWLVGRVTRPISRQIGATSRYGRSRQQLCEFLKAFVARQVVQQCGYKFEWTETESDGAVIVLLEYPADLFAMCDGPRRPETRSFAGPKDISVSPGAFLVLLAYQGETCREKDVARLEFTSFTDSIGPHVARHVSPGVWEVDGAEQEHVHRLLTAACAQVGAVRRQPLQILTVACNDEDALAAALPPSTCDLGGACWSLDFELCATAGESIKETLPFQPACATSLAVSIAVKLAKRIANGQFVRAHDAAVRLVVVQLRVPGSSALVLCRELAEFRLLAARVRQTWEGRPFQFDASTTYSVASAVVNLALATVAKRRHKRLDEIASGAEGLRFLDACTGTGTMLAAAISSRAFGAGIVGCDLRRSFIEGVRRNLEYAFGDEFLRAENVTLAVQDALMPWSLHDCSPRFDVVVANPPWGLRSVPS
jgi:hypothetical protein